MVKYRNYEIAEDGGKLCIRNTETGTEKQVKILTDASCDFIFKCLKSQIKTRYTAGSLLEWFKSLIAKDFGTAYISAICKKYVG